MNIKNGFTYFVRIVIPVICLFLAVWGYVLYESTLVKWWIPVTGAIFMAVFIMPLLLPVSRKITTIENYWLNSMCSLIMAGTLAYFTLLGVNYWLADAGTEHEIKGTVIEKIADEQRRYRRVGRGRMVPTGERYYNYYIVVEFEGDHVKKMPVNAKAYSRIRTGSVRTYHQLKGLLGFYVIK